MTEGNFAITTAQIRVNPEHLAAKASSIEGKLRGLTAALTEFEQKVNRTGGYWSGEAGDLYRSKYQESKEEIYDMLDRIRSHAGNLSAIARNSSENERESEELAESLMEQVII